MKKLKDIGKKVIAGIFLACGWIIASLAQTHKDTAISAIRHSFQQTNSDKSLHLIRLDEESVTGHTTDNGGELKGYFKSDTLRKMTLDIGLSYGIMGWEYYFDKGQIIFIYETEKDYPVDSTTGGLDNRKTVLAFEGRYYYENRTLINTVFRGKKRMADNNPTAYAKALPSTSEIDTYIKLLKKRAKVRS